ncbi:MAG: hypothetical protein OQK12_09305 [Motiliproteus sp.]|nr:hypothetical protein [Motiliproteus sp.]MCW9054048.1 hypothetical protein [Motiliproteus sp.]
MELIVTIVLTALILGSLLFVLSRSTTPNYRPSRPKVADLLQKVIEGDATQQAWDLFIGYPILHDPELEEIRQRCITLSEGDEHNSPFPSGIGRFIFNRAGREKVKEIYEDLQKLIASNREF